MNRLKVFSILAVLAMVLNDCAKETQIVTGGFPDQIVVSIPDAISSTEQTKSLLIESCDVLSISGDSIYKWVRGFIKVGKTSANFVQDIFTVLKKYNIDRPITFNFTGADGIQKRVVVEEITARNNTSDLAAKYNMKLTLTNMSDTNKIGMQIFWNNSTKEGFTVVRPNICNSKEGTAILNPDLKFRIEFTSVKTDYYDQKMVVSISGFTGIAERNFMNRLKMEVTKKGTMVTIKGNSNHPNAYLLNSSKGLSYAFVAKGELSKNIGVIKLALPSIAFDSTDVFSNYSVEQVVRREINNYALAHSLTIGSVCMDAILVNCKVPAYYDANGFKGSGSIKPNADFEGEISSLDGLLPYAPSELENMILNFE